MRTGLHINSWKNPHAVLDYYRRTDAPVAKVVGQFHGGNIAALAGMGVAMIGRVYWKHQSLDKGAHAAFVTRLVDEARRQPHIEWWEGCNEFAATAPDIGVYAQREIERMAALEKIGKRAVIGNFATGEPRNLDDWALFRPALERALAGGHALGLHEYAGPYMQMGTRVPSGLNQMGPHGFTGASGDCWNPKLDGWLTLRYRMVYARLRQWGLGGLPLFITESGVDNAPAWPDRPGPVGRGWRDFARTSWASAHGIGDYADQRRWYSWQLGQDPYVRGVVDYGFATEDPDWESFDLSREPAMLDRLISAESDLPRGHWTTPGPRLNPAPEPDPSMPVHGVRYRAHVMRRGETLFRLGGHRWREILRAVPMGAVTEIPVGAVVLVPEDIQ